MDHKPNWNLKASDVACLPKGERRALDEALNFLGPFKCDLISQEKEGVLSRQFAENWIAELARSVNRRWILAGRAEAGPRLSEVAKVFSAAHQLPEIFELLELFGKKLKPKVMRSLKTVLGAVTEFETGLTIGTGSETLAGLDRGGRSNFVKEYLGSAEYYLVSFGWPIFETFRPEEATVKENSPFHLFLARIFEFATGSPDEREVLHWWIKQLLPALRNADSAVTDSAGLFDEQMKLYEAQIAGNPDRPAIESLQAVRRTHQTELDAKMALLSPSRKVRKRVGG